MPASFINLSVAEYRRFMSDDSVWTDPITQEKRWLDDEDLCFSSKKSQPFVPLDRDTLEEKLAMTVNDAHESAHIGILSADVYGEDQGFIGPVDNTLQAWLKRDRSLQEAIVLRKVATATENQPLEDTPTRARL